MTNTNASNLTIENNTNTFFTQVSNLILRDNTLSALAKTIYFNIQSYANIPNFIIYKKNIQKNFKESPTTFDNAIKELKNKGYLEIKRHPDKTGKFAYDYTIKNPKATPNKPCKTDTLTTTYKSNYGKNPRIKRTYFKKDLNTNVSNNSSYVTPTPDKKINDIYTQYPVNVKPEVKPEVKPNINVEVEVKVEHKEKASRINKRLKRKAAAQAKQARKEAYIKQQEATKRKAQAIDEAIEKQLEISTLTGHEYKVLLDYIVMIIKKLAKRNSTIRISKEYYNAIILHNKINKLTKRHLLYILDVYLNYAKNIQNDENFLIKVIFEAPERIDAWYAKKELLERQATAATVVTKGKTTPTNKFHNFDQREYDYDALLKQINSTSSNIM